MSKELIEFSNALAHATERATASAVAVHTESRGSSSGIVWRAGVIVTSEHALRRDEEIQLTLPDGRVVLRNASGPRPLNRYRGPEMCRRPTLRCHLSAKRPR